MDFTDPFLIEPFQLARAGMGTIQGFLRQQPAISISAGVALFSRANTLQQSTHHRGWLKSLLAKLGLRLRYRCWRRWCFLVDLAGQVAAAQRAVGTRPIQFFQGWQDFRFNIRHQSEYSLAGL